MSHFYKQIDSLPSIPGELLTDLEKFYSNKLNVYRATLDLDPDTVKFDYKTQYNGSLDKKTFYNFEITDSPLLAWLKENIATDAIQHGVTVFGAYADNNRPFHIDYSRDYVLMYVTDTGGTDVITSFFKSTTRPLVLDNDTYSTFDKEELILLDSVKVEPESWVFMHTKVIHRVSQLTGVRRSVQLGFNYNKYNLNTSATLTGD